MGARRFRAAAFSPDLPFRSVMRRSLPGFSRPRTSASPVFYRGFAVMSGRATAVADRPLLMA